MVSSSSALAQVANYAVILGANRGAIDELPLHYAEADADKFAAVMHSLGRVPAENLVQLRAPSAKEAQRALIAMNARIRSETGPGRDSLLLVYYSGHADAEALHLGSDRLDLPLLKRLVQGSAADFRLLILDACRSGAITRSKGGRPIAPFPIEWQGELSGQGFAVLAASAADEDAQESDELKGSFFTHYLVSGLRGAADRDGNSVVTLTEAYAHAYRRTLQASSRSFGGTQHPSFRFDLEGKDALPLSWLAERNSQHGWLKLPERHAYLILSRGASGPVVAELGRNDRQRRLVLEPGRYFLRGRAPTHLLEGVVEVHAGQELIVEESQLARVDYSRLARKGGAGRGDAHQLRAGYRVRTPLWANSSFCQGSAAGYALHLPSLTLAAEVSFCRTRFNNAASRSEATVSTTADEVSSRASAHHIFDSAPWTLSIGVAAGAAWLHQSFRTRGKAPDRHSLAGLFGPELRLYRSAGAGYFFFGEVGTSVHVFRQQTGARTATAAALTISTGVGLGKRF